jgi:glutathione S-transferase
MEKPMTNDRPLTLYASPLACSGAVQLVMYELGVSAAIEWVDIYQQPHILLSSRAVYKERNPKDAVPALDVGSGELLTEVGVIMQWLCDHSPGSSLLPAARTNERYRVMEWLSYVGSEVHKTIGPLFNPRMPEEGKALHRLNLDRRVSFIERHLETSPFLAGADFTIADAYLFVMLGWEPYSKVDLGPYPNLRRYHARIASRRSFTRLTGAIAPVLSQMKLPVFPGSSPRPTVGTVDDAAASNRGVC